MTVHPLTVRPTVSAFIVRRWFRLDPSKVCHDSFGGFLFCPYPHKTKTSPFRKLAKIVYRRSSDSTHPMTLPNGSKFVLSRFCEQFGETLRGFRLLFVVPSSCELRFSRCFDRIAERVDGCRECGRTFGSLGCGHYADRVHGYGCSAFAASGSADRAVFTSSCTKGLKVS